MTRPIVWLENSVREDDRKQFGMRTAMIGMALYSLPVGVMMARGAKPALAAAWAIWLFVVGVSFRF